MPKQQGQRKRLAQHMDARRVFLGLRWADVADRAGLTTETLRQVRQGPGEIRPLTRRGIEEALEWELGSVTAILDGGEPTPLAQQAVVRDLPSTPGTRVVAAVIEALETEEEVQAALDQAVETAHRKLAELKLAAERGKPRLNGTR